MASQKEAIETRERNRDYRQAIWLNHSATSEEVEQLKRCFVRQCESDSRRVAITSRALSSEWHRHRVLGGNRHGDGSIVTIKGNSLQASYEGGDGNDLTPTVVP